MLNSKFMTIANKVIFDLSESPESKSPEAIRALVKYFATSHPLNPIKLNEDEIEQIAKYIEFQYGITIGEGVLLEGEDEFEPWLQDKERSPDFEPYFWNRYRQYLIQKQLPENVISTLDKSTGKILDRLGNPDKDGKWDRRGMVVGHVQSGKTANFIGLINKASDTGYKLIIILAGMIEDLRSQTQIRIDEGYIGKDSSKKNDVNQLDTFIGVGKLTPGNNRVPMSFTDKLKDFTQTHNFRPSGYDEATILVVKKNTSILRRLKEWLQRNNSDLNGTISDLPVLLIDDEADHASVNTNNPDKNPTAINSRIREILKLFKRKSYLAYTATPFANIFIEPDQDDEMLEDDLFPKDFIYSMEAASNYVGAEKIFNDTSEESIIREINDFEDILSIKHKSGERLVTLPDTLYEAIHSFIIIKAIRILRNQDDKHNSMLIHVSRFKDVQRQVYDKVLVYMQNMQNNIRSYYKLDTLSALKNEYIKKLYDVWEKEYSYIINDWNKIQNLLVEAIVPIDTKLINGDTKENLDYAIYENGLNVIAIGGDRLSRGLTLEGLTVSYFYRNTSMYDTLMQMGRWFGYRDGYADLCRIYLTNATESYFGHIAEASEELRDEIQYMFERNLTPKDFGLKVRTHPGSLLITAKNKMRSSTVVSHKIDLKGRLIESDKLDITPENREHNWNLLNSLVENLNKNYTYDFDENTKYNYVFKNVSINYIIDFVKRFKNQSRSHMTDTKPVVAYLNNAKSASAFTEWDVVLINNNNEKAKTNVANLNVKIQRRSIDKSSQNDRYKKDSFIEISSRRKVSNINAEMAGMSIEDINKAFEDFKKNSKNSEAKISSMAGKYLRKYRVRPLLMLHVMNVYEDLKVDESLLEKDLFAYGMSFPLEGPYIEEVEFAVNTTYLKNQNEGYYEDDEE